MNRIPAWSLVSALACTSLICGAAQAQTTDTSTEGTTASKAQTPPPPPPPPVDAKTASAPAATAGGDTAEIVVTGIRLSLETSLETKKTADQIMDAISAEDIGKLPDKNIGEALQRVTGVQLTREGGEGKNINIRGIDAALNRVEYNGSTALSTDTSGGRNVDFRDFPSEMVSKLEVIKSQTADITEGGLGGTVRIISRKPLDNGGKDYYAASAEGLYSDISRTTDPRVALFASHSFNDASFGILGGVVWESRRQQTDEMLSTGWVQPIDANGDGADDYFPYLPRDVIVREKNDRLAFNTILQWKPTDNLDTYLEGMYTKRNYDKDDQFLQVNVQSGTLDPDSVTYASDNQTVQSFDSYTGADTDMSITQRSLLDTFRNDIYQLATGFTWDNGPMELTSRLTHAQMKYDQVSYGPTATIDDVPRVTVDMDNKYRAPNFDFHGLDILDPANFTSASVSIQPRSFRQKNDDAKLDMDYALDTSFLSKIETGVEYNRFEVSSDITKITQTLSGLTDSSVIPTIQSAVSEYATTNSIPFFHTKDVGFALPTWYKFNHDYIDAIGAGNLQPAEDYANTWDIVESTWGGYGKLDFDAPTTMPIKGNVGVRVFQTRVTTQGFDSSGTDVDQIASYSDVMPSGGVTIGLVPDILLLKGAFSSMLARPAPSQMAPSLTVDLDTLTASRGNPDIKPYRAKQYDLSLEWYPTRISYLSAAVFYKDVSSFVQTVHVEDTVAGHGDTIFDVSQPENSGAGVGIMGTELGGQLDFGELIPALTGFGAIANLTYAKDNGTPNISAITGKELPFAGLSKTSYNATLYYQDYGFNIRLAYNWRDKYLTTASGRGGLPEWQEAYGQLDASVAYDVNDNLSIYAQGTNLTNSISLQDSSSELRRNFVLTNGPRVSAGFRLKF